MRQILLIIIFGFLPAFSPLFASAADTLVGNSEFYLEMKGRVLESHGQSDDEKESLDSAAFSILNESSVIILSGYSDSKGRLAFKLPLGRKFTLTFTKKGFVRKMIIVDTHVPADARKAFVFAFDVDIFELIKGLDVSVLEKPVARVAFKPTEKIFTYDIGYTNKINAALQKMYRDYYALRRKEDMASQSDSIPAAKKPGAKKMKSEPYGNDSRPR